MDEKLLITLNLNESELSLYKALLTAGSLTPVALAKAADLKRTTAYSVARSLIDKGLIVEDTTRRPRIFAPATAEEILNLIQIEKKKIAEREQSLKNLASELSKISAKSTYPVPIVRFIEEKRIETFLNQQIIDWNESLLATEPTWWGFQDHTFVEQYGDWITKYWKQSPKDVDLKLLSNRAEAEVQFAKTAVTQRVVKFWGEATNFISTTWVIGDYVIIINTRNQPFYLIEIHDKLMAHDQREVFKNLWSLV
jgi:sugar-specific transcriptional regulator TrmB